MSAGSIPKIRNAVVSNLTLTGATVTTTGLASPGAGYITYALVFTSSGAGATVDIKLQECDTVAGTYVDVTGGAIATITTPADTEAAVVCAKALGRKAFTRLSITTAVAAAVAKGCVCVTTGLSTEPTNATGTAVLGTYSKFV